MTTVASPSYAGAVAPPSGNYYAAGSVVPLQATPTTVFSSTIGLEQLLTAPPLPPR